jgi:hypothetical protein
MESVQIIITAHLDVKLVLIPRTVLYAILGLKDLLIPMEPIALVYVLLVYLTMEVFNVNHASRVV